VEASSDRRREEIDRRFVAGRIVRGIVKRTEYFGVFVDLNDPDAYGLITVTDLTDEPPVKPGDYPPVGSEIVAVVMGVTGQLGTEVRLSIRPSLLGNSL
jgi:ribosomal protein S1